MMLAVSAMPGLYVGELTDIKKHIMLTSPTHTKLLLLSMFQELAYLI